MFRKREVSSLSVKLRDFKNSLENSKFLFLHTGMTVVNFCFCVSIVRKLLFSSIIDFPRNPVAIPCGFLLSCWHCIHALVICHTPPLPISPSLCLFSRVSRGCFSGIATSINHTRQQHDNSSVTDTNTTSRWCHFIYCAFWTNTIFFIISVSCVWIGMLLERVVESSLLSKYEHLTPNIDQVMPV